MTTYGPKFIMSYTCYQTWYQLLGEGNKAHIHASPNRLQNITQMVKLSSNRW